jgi:hypothetical protein
VIPVTRTLAGSGRHQASGHRYLTGASGVRPGDGGTPRISRPLPVSIPGQLPYAGMDPSDPATWVRPWNPQYGMVARLNFDGAIVQGAQPTGGLQRGRQQRRKGYR